MPWSANDTAKGLSVLWGLSFEETMQTLDSNGKELLRVMGVNGVA
jgi:hypothetical protein